MTDPLDALRHPPSAEAPDPIFAAALRLRLQQALERPAPVAFDELRRVTGRSDYLDPDELTADEQQRLSETAEFPVAIGPDSPREIRQPIGRPAFDDDLEARMTIPIRINQLSPYLAVADGRRAIDFYVAAFGATLGGDPIYMAGGKLGHATLLIGPVRVFLAEEFPEMGLIAPGRAGGVSVTLHLSLASADEVDVAASRAVEAGATLERAVADGPYGRAGVVVDPAGHRWFLLFEPPA
ncbi:VOC family protein [Cryptosporangium phraense]|uniref:VOC family protein n=1 Tax=Cryptosporangium phraense TaxID=2593070 RepID=A0A545AFH1_9ACTN|nr:VOC family protein [Cryptosporangium phraense]TQS40086.1 VOC family protein [Cryptosporangium phraense]